MENREKKEETGCEVICGAPTTPAGKGMGEGEGGKQIDLFLCLSLYSVTFTLYLNLDDKQDRR